MVRSREMSTHVRSTIDRLATRFTTDLLALVAAASVEELVDFGGTPDSAARPRIAGGGWASGGHDLSRVVKALRSTPGGMRSEELQKTLHLSKSAVVAAVNRALASGTIRKTGARRGTRYFAV